MKVIFFPHERYQLSWHNYSEVHVHVYSFQRKHEQLNTFARICQDGNFLSCSMETLRLRNKLKLPQVGYVIHKLDSKKVNMCVHVYEHTHRSRFDNINVDVHIRPNVLIQCSLNRQYRHDQQGMEWIGVLHVCSFRLTQWLKVMPTW